MKTNILIQASLVLLFGLFFLNEAKAQSDSDRDTLAGLKGVSVLIESVKPEIERLGISAKQLQTDVELRLRRAGIPVIDSVDTFLYVNLSVHKLDDYSFAYTITVSLNQPVILSRNKAISTIAPTWSDGFVGTAGLNKLHTMREAVADLVDTFINDYLAASSQTSTQSPPFKIQPESSSNQKDDSPFIAHYVGGDRAPEVKVTNNADRTLYLRLGEKQYQVSPSTAQNIILEHGIHTFKATAPNTLPLEGEKEFQRGYVYTWTFYIVTRTSPSTSPVVIPRRRRGRRP